MADFRLEIEPALAEETVLLALRARGDEERFRQERDPLYSIPDPDQREAAFDALHVRWFEQLDLARPVSAALGGEERIGREASSCLLRRARRRQEEGVELLVRASDRSGRTVRILLQPCSFLARERLLAFLRRELLHVSDLLDPRFGYAPALPGWGETELPVRLLLERYALVWNVTVDGRLERRGHSSPGARERREREFRRAFAMLEEEAAARTFARFYEGERPTHLELLDFARKPGAI